MMLKGFRRGIDVGHNAAGVQLMKIVCNAEDRVQTQLLMSVTNFITTAPIHPCDIHYKSVSVEMLF